MIHLVRRQYLHAEVDGTEADGLALQRRLPPLLKQSVSPAIGEVLDRYAPHDDHLIVERLELDLGTLSVADLERDLARSVAQALEKKVRQLVDAAATQGAWDAGAAAEPRGVDAEAAASGGTARKSRRELCHAAFCFFLASGRLPWSFRLPAGQTLEQVLLQMWDDGGGGVSGISPPEADTVVQALTSAAARKRLIRQFSSPFRERMLDLLSPKALRELREALGAVRDLPLRPSLLKEMERDLAERVFAAVADASLPSAMDLVVAALRGCCGGDAVEGDGAVVRELERRWPGGMISSRECSNGATSGVAMGIGKTAAGVTETTEAVGRKRTQRGAPLPFSREDLLTAEGAEGFYVENAGSVLLHPFLARFFEALGVADGERLLRPERAISLLHHLCTGASTAPEYEVTLFKVLCNVDLQLPVESEVDLSAVEREEANAMLRAVIGHWEALRNTSPDGLRATFLLRPGKLSLREDGDWLLQVEPQTFDILLDHLPWGVSMVKLPWMAQMLWVEWR